MNTKAKVYLLDPSLNHKSRMKREFHVRFCERQEGKFLLSTRRAPGMAWSAMDGALNCKTKVKQEVT